MKNLFSGLEKFGIKTDIFLDVYDKVEENKKSKTTEIKNTELDEADVIFDKTYTCPICDKEFKSKVVKTGKVKLVSMDSDLRPKYQTVDSLKYDAIVCPNCGYAALNRFFNNSTSVQLKLIKEEISNNFKGLKTDLDIYSYDESIIRHKLALANAVVRKAKSSEKAYICLKTAWLIRGKIENISKDTINDTEEIKKLQIEENDFIMNAYKGFTTAFSNELFPMCGMDEMTLTYLVADLSRKIGNHEESSRWVSKILISRDANERIKSKARELKELLKDTN